MKVTLPLKINTITPTNMESFLVVVAFLGYEILNYSQKRPL